MNVGEYRILLDLPLLLLLQLIPTTLLAYLHHLAHLTHLRSLATLVVWLLTMRNSAIPDVTIKIVKRK